MVSHPPRGPRRDRGLASSLQRRAAAHEPELLDPDRVPIAASTPVHDPQPSRLPGINGLRILGHVRSMAEGGYCRASWHGALLNANYSNADERSSSSCGAAKSLHPTIRPSIT